MRVGKTPIWVEIVCRTCSASSPGRFVWGGRIPVMEVREESGFIFMHDECFCSLACLHEFEGVKP